MDMAARETSAKTGSAACHCPYEQSNPNAIGHWDSNVDQNAQAESKTLLLAAT